MAVRVGYLSEEILPPEMKSETVRLADGRRLGIMQTGDPGGKPVFFFHGFGVSRLAVHPDEGIARLLGVRVISLDRPGIGLSDPQPGRTLTGWAADAAAVADFLGIRRFAVLGWSGGGPHALACAAVLSERVTAVGLAGSAAPMSGPECDAYLPRDWQRIAALARYAPWLMRVYFDRFSKQLHNDPQGVMAQSLADMVPADQEIAGQQYFYTTLLVSAMEAYAQGSRGVLSDALTLSRPWGFALEAIRTPVLLWHGRHDQTWPLPVGQYLAQKIPGCRPVYYPEEGHLIYLSHWAEMLQALAGEG